MTAQNSRTNSAGAVARPVSSLKSVSSSALSLSPQMASNSERQGRHGSPDSCEPKSDSSVSVITVPYMPCQGDVKSSANTRGLSLITLRISSSPLQQKPQNSHPLSLKPRG